MDSGVLSLRGRIGLRGWGITTRAPRRLSNRHWLGQLRPRLRVGPQTQHARTSLSMHLSCLTPSTIMLVMSSHSVQKDTLSALLAFPSLTFSSSYYEKNVSQSLDLRRM